MIWHFVIIMLIQPTYLAGKPMYNKKYKYNKTELPFYKVKLEFGIDNGGLKRKLMQKKMLN